MIRWSCYLPDISNIQGTLLREIYGKNEIITTEGISKSPKASQNSGLNFEDVNVDLKLSVFLKRIHATWSVEMYDFLSLYLSQGLVTLPCQGKRSCPGDRISLKTRN